MKTREKENISSRTHKGLFVMLLSLGTLAMGCAGDLSNAPTDSEDNGNIVNTDKGDGTTTTQVDASADDSWVYMDLESKSEVFPENPEGSADWDLAFQRFKIKSNGGVSGTGGVQIAALSNTDFSGLTQAPSSGYMSDQEDSSDLDSDPDYVFLGSDPWFSYSSSDHTLTPRDVIYVLRSVEESYYKIQMVDYYDAAGTSGFPSFNWAEVDAPANNGGTSDEIAVDASASDVWVYLDLGTKSVVDVSSPSTSTDWDMAFSRTQIKTNSGTSGDAMAGARSPLDGASYSAISTSPTVGFLIDEMLPVPGPPGSGEYSGNPVLAEWYNYDGSTHEVSPKDEAFLIRAADGNYFKTQITAYDDGLYKMQSSVLNRLVETQTSTLDVSDNTSWVYMNFRVGDVATPTDSETSLLWDVGFQGASVQTNSGTSGQGEGGAIDPSVASLSEIESPPAGQGCYLMSQGHICKCELSENECSDEGGIWTGQCDCDADYSVDEMLPIPGPPNSGDFSGNPVLNGWYDYDADTHVVSPKDKAFVVRTADGGYVKVKVTDYSDGALTIDWAYAGAGKSDF